MRAPGSERLRIIVLSCYSKMALAVIDDLADGEYELLGGAAKGDTLPFFSPDSLLRSRHLSNVFRYTPPLEDEEQFKNDLIAACERYGAQVVIPCGHAVAIVASRYKREIESASGTRVLTADPEILSPLADKWETFRIASQLDIPCPRTQLLMPESLPEIERFRYPIVVKPRHKTGGEDITFFASFDILLSSLRDLRSTYASYTHADAPFLAQEAVTGPIHDVVLIARDGEIGPILTQQRIMTLFDFGGAGIINKTTYEPGAMALAERMVAHTRWSGPAMFEFVKRGPDDYVLLECNPRFWGTTRVAIEAGLRMGRELMDMLVHDQEVVRNDSYQRDFVFKFLFPDCLYSWTLEPRRPGAIFARIRKTLARHGAVHTGNNLKRGDLRHLLGFVLHGREH